MTPVPLQPYRTSYFCSINDRGTVSIPQRVLDQLGWTVPARIAVSYILEAPLTLLLGRAREDQPGFTLSPLNRSGGQTSGGKLTCMRFARQVLGRRVPLPVSELTPVLLRQVEYELALVLEPWPWQAVTFSQAGLKALEKDHLGVYELVGRSGEVLRVGEGWLRQRMSEHLKLEPYLQDVELLRYVPLAKADAVVMEKVLLQQHLAAHGELPRYNRRLA